MSMCFICSLAMHPMVRAREFYRKTLGDENRLRIVKRICRNGEVCACSLLEDLDVTQPTLSHHMRLLKECGLVNARKEGRWMYYSLNEKHLSILEKAVGEICHRSKTAVVDSLE